MDPALKQALQGPDVKRVLMEAASHADTVVRRYVWRGHRPEAAGSTELMVGDKTAADFVQEAVKRLCDGTRAYNSARTLFENINSVTDSLIWSAKKSSDRTGVVDYQEASEDGAKTADPISYAISLDEPPDARSLTDELKKAQSDHFEMLKRSFDGNKEMQEYLDALSIGYFDPQEIETVTGVPVNRIYELRRKLKNYAPRFFGVTDYKHLERKIVEGK